MKTRNVERWLGLMKIEFVYGTKAFLAFIGIVFLFLNILMSQLISPLYFKFVNEDKASIVLFLKKTKVLPEYQDLLAEQRKIYGYSVQSEIYANEQKRKHVIQQLESLLQTNAKSRDLLYDLYLLYEQDGDMQKAQMYLERAKELDPMVEQNTNY